jgi:hypothetical protein
MIISRCCRVPHVIELCSHSNYLYSMTVIKLDPKLNPYR